MKRVYNITIIGLMVCATMLATGCKKDGDKVALRVKIAQESDAKVYMNGPQACWHEGDLVNVNGDVCQAEDIDGPVASFYGTPLTGIFYAVYPADIVNEGANSDACEGIIDVTLPNVQVYGEDVQGRQIVKVPLGGRSWPDHEDSQDMILYPLSSLVKIVFSSEIDFTLERIELTAAGHALSGAGTATITDEGVANTITMASSDTSHSVALDFSQSGNQQIRHGERNTYVYYIPVPSYAGSDDITITLQGSQGGRGVYKNVEKENVTLSRNSIATVRMSVNGEWDWMEEMDPNELCGVFSIGNGRTVRFSRGNLQYRYNPSAQWRFAEHQYDFVGGYEEYYPDEDEGGMDRPGNMGVNNYNNAVVRDDYTGWLDLFPWGSWAPGGSSPRYTEGYPNTPTSWYTTIDGCSDWFTMSESELRYLLYQRDNAANKRGVGYLGGAEGLILLPDNWVLPQGCSFIPGVVIFEESEGSHTEFNNYSLQQWEAMEAAGAVFLPAGGLRMIYSEGTEYIYWHDDNWYYALCGYYWTTTTYHNNWDDGSKGLIFSFAYISADPYSDDPYSNEITFSGSGASVRLVREYSNSIGSKNSIIGKKRTK